MDNKKKEYSKQQLSLIRLYCERAKVSMEDVMKRLEEGKTTISEIKFGVLGIKVG